MLAQEGLSLGVVGPGPMFAAAQYFVLMWYYFAGAGGYSSGCSTGSAYSISNGILTLLAVVGWRQAAGGSLMHVAPRDVLPAAVPRW